MMGFHHSLNLVVLTVFNPPFLFNVAKTLTFNLKLFTFRTKTKELKRLLLYYRILLLPESRQQAADEQ